MTLRKLCTAAITCLLVQASGTPAQAGKARYQMDLTVQENTYAQNHSLDYSGIMLNRLTLNAKDEFNRKTILAGNRAISQQQGKVALSMSYDINKRLTLGGRMTESVNSNGIRTDGANDYNLRGTYAGSDSTSVTQTVGSVSEERFGIRDWGVKYTTSASYRLPDAGDADVRVHGTYADDDLRWGQSRLGGGGSFYRQYQPGSTVRLSYDLDRRIKRDSPEADTDADAFTVTTLTHAAVLGIGYKLGETGFNIGCDYNRQGVTSRNRSAYARSVDFDEREFLFDIDINDFGTAGIVMDGGFALTDRTTTYPDVTRNENLGTVAFKGTATVMDGPLDGMRLNGNYKKSVLMDEDGEDDRDDITVLAAAAYPVSPFAAAACSLESDIVLKKTVYINNLRSQNSRWNKLYRIGPRLNYRLAPWLSLNQKYILSARYIEHVIKEYYGDLGLPQVDDLRDRLTRELTLENGLQATLAAGMVLTAGYDYTLEEQAQFEGGLFESVFKRMPTGLKGSHAYRMNVSWIPLRRLTVSPSYEFNHWHEDELDYDMEKDHVAVSDSRTYRKHTARFMMRYQLRYGSANLSSVYVFKNLDGTYEEKKQIQFSLQLPLL